ncbi:MAG: DUF222 domain-containing protein [Microcella sp.]|uniref:HNH endonuclease signature motif containing protein n=1 Tax=Microcella sp. TaxID=1913979 RepID=UPI0024C51995|nr:HNH endonuclease signature motif containing protein [Microcella sp.]UYN82603.1 MAG: DUF222 domain-containing protein [Microcella sp.]
MTASLLAALEIAHRALLDCADAGSMHECSDEALLETLHRAAEVRRLVDARSAVLAGEVARRSTAQLSHDGLAQRHGHRTAEELVRVTTGSSKRDARVAVRAGTLLAESLGEGDEGDARPSLPEWAHALVEPVTQGRLSTAALESIRSGLGDVSETVNADALKSAVRALIIDAESLDVDRLFRRARQVRDEIDTAGIADRERARRDARSLRVFRGSDGMTRATWVLDPESAAVVTDLYDRATSPRRGGPTFLSPRDVELIERMNADERTPEQYASDAFLDLLRAGADADSSALLSSGAPSVRIVVTARDLLEGSGSAHIEGQTDPVSLPTARRMLCDGTQAPILIATTGQPLDVGRTQRFFTPRQRVALAARDGGCRWSGCDRPPSWCEAHHIQPWEAENGRTDVADGVLLCRHHHLLVHNNGWRIERHRGPDGLDEYRAIPPARGAGTTEPLALRAHDQTLRRALPARPAA